MEYIDQVKNVIVFEDTVTTTYLDWENTESGRNECTTYAVKNFAGQRYYEAVGGKSHLIFEKDKFYETLEKMYLSIRK